MELHHNLVVWVGLFFVFCFFQRVVISHLLLSNKSKTGVELNSSVLLGETFGTIFYNFPPLCQLKDMVWMKRKLNTCVSLSITIYSSLEN